jgi:predicted Ser/Thr protein kinase
LFYSGEQIALEPRQLQILEEDVQELLARQREDEIVLGFAGSRFRPAAASGLLRARANNAGRNPAWNTYEKLREVIEKKMFSNTEDLLPVISFNAKASEEDRTKHENFVARMVAKGYTEKQVRLLCDWYLRVRKSS